ncbi:phage regulatory protein/antirepressor Ant, partial [Clostridium botulinum]|nr:phage regulatory protein/antirepressor Ant [Clostridium botulinum]
GKYFITIENKFEKPNGEIKINVKTVVYQKGLDYIRKLLKKYYI